MKAPDITVLIRPLGYSGIVLLMQPFHAAYGICGPVQAPDGSMITKCTLTALQQSLTSLSILFIGLGAAIRGVVGNYLGRRGARGHLSEFLKSLFVA